MGHEIKMRKLNMNFLEERTRENVFLGKKLREEERVSNAIN